MDNMIVCLFPQGTQHAAFSLNKLLLCLSDWLIDSFKLCQGNLKFKMEEAISPFSPFLATFELFWVKLFYICKVLPEEVRSGGLKNKESASLAWIINVEHIVDGKRRMWFSNSRVNICSSAKLSVLLLPCFQEKLMKIAHETILTDFYRTWWLQEGKVYWWCLFLTLTNHFV